MKTDHVNPTCMCHYALCDMPLWSDWLVGLSHCIQRHFCLLQLKAPRGHQKWIERDQTNAHLQMSLSLPGYQLSTREDIEPLLLLPLWDMSFICTAAGGCSPRKRQRIWSIWTKILEEGILINRSKQRDGEKKEENPIKSLKAGSESRHTHVVSAGCASPRRSLQSTSCSLPTSSVQECR